MTKINYEGYHAILTSAERHGKDSEPEHEVGDLQQALAIAWEVLGEKGRQTLVERFFDEIAEDSDIGEGPKNEPIKKGQVRDRKGG